MKKVLLALSTALFALIFVFSLSIDKANALTAIPPLELNQNQVSQVVNILLTNKIISKKQVEKVKSLFGVNDNTNYTIKYDAPVTTPKTGDSWLFNDPNKVINWTYPNELAGKLIYLTIKLVTPDQSKQWLIYSEYVNVADPSLGQGLDAGVLWSELSKHFSESTVPLGKYNILVSADDSSKMISHRGLGGQFNIVAPSKNGSSPTVKTLDKGTLKLTYDSSKKESLISGTQRVSVTADETDAYITWLALDFKHSANISTPHGLAPNSTRRSFDVISGATRETLRVDGSNETVWKVLAGHTAQFNVSITASPKEMFAGGYSVSLASVVYIEGDEWKNLDNKGVINSDVVTIVGENSNSTQPASSVSFLSPKLNDTYTAGKVGGVKYTSNGLNGSAFKLYAVNQKTQVSYLLSSGSVIKGGNDGEAFTFPESMIAGQYKIMFEVNNKEKYVAYSDSFNIISSNTTVCSTEYAPVCGSDGKTYSNKCKASVAGVTVIATSECTTNTTRMTTTELDQGWYYGSLSQKKLGTPTTWTHSGEGTKDAKWSAPVTTAVNSPLKINITAPSAGEKLTLGQTYRIKWDSSKNIDKVTLGYSFGEGSLNWMDNNASYNIANKGYYDWNVNVGNTTNTKIRFWIIGYQTGVGSVDSYSGYFNISPAPSYGQCYSTGANDWPFCCNVNDDSAAKSTWQDKTGSWTKRGYSCSEYPGYTMTPSTTITPPSLNTVSSLDGTTINVALKPGDEGKQVSALQSALKQIGLYSGEITGFFGDLTKKSVMKFQTANSLDAVGEVGPKTRDLLNFVLSR